MTLAFKGILKGHGDMVTSITTVGSAGSATVLSGSRDKKLIIWEMNPEADYGEVGVAKKALTGHGQSITDCALSNAAGGDKFAISSSMDATLRLWDLEKGQLVRKFTGHTKDVNSVAFSPDSRQVVSGSRDNTVKIWNTRSECKFTSAEQGHSDWVSSVRFSPNQKVPTLVSASWDKTVKVWSMAEWKLQHTFYGHEAPVHTVCVSPDGSLCASGAKDSTCILWDLFHQKQVYTLGGNKDSGAVNSLCFSPCNYWLCAAMDKSIRIWELENKQELCDIVLKYKPTKRELRKAANNQGVAVEDEFQDSGVPMVDRCNNDTLHTTLRGSKPPSRHIPWATCLQWDTAGRTLYVGTSTGDIHVFDQRGSE